MRKIKIEAPRGDIVDRDGNRLVRTRVGAGRADRAERAARGRARGRRRLPRARARAAERARLAAADQLRALERSAAARRSGATRAPSAASAACWRAPRAAPGRSPCRRCRASDRELRRRFRRLGRVLGMSPRTIHRRVIEGIAEAPYSNVTIKTDVAARRLQLPQGAPGRVPRRRRREAVPARLPAQGARPPSCSGRCARSRPTSSSRRRYRGVDAGHAHRQGRHRGDLRPLPARPGRLHARRHQRARQPRRPPRGHAPRAPAGPAAAADARPRPPARRQQRDQARDRGRQRATATRRRRAPTWRWTRRNGEVLALGSYPSFDANVFAKPLSQETFDKLNSEENGAPLFNRAIAAAYPTGSTFKPITAMAALEEGIITPTQTIFDDGEFKLGPQVVPQRARTPATARSRCRARSRSPPTSSSTRSASGPTRAARSSSSWARRLGLGRRTGIDIPGEFDGLVPDRKWRDAGFAKYSRCVKREKVPAQTLAALQKCGGIERPWSTGDNVNLAVGQGDLQATPLQMAAAYSAIANGGKVVRPHLAHERRGRPRPRGRAVPHHRQAAREVLRDQPGDDHGRPAAGGDGGRTAPRPTSSRALRAASSRSTARPVPWSARGSPTSPGTPPTCPIPAAPSSSSSPSRRAASAPRRPRRRRG